MLYIAKGALFLWRRFPRSALAIASLSILSGLIPASSAWAGKKILDDVVARLRSTDGTASIGTLAFWLGAAAALAFLGIVIRWRQSVAQDWLQRAGAVEIDRILVDRVQAVGLLTRESPEFADRQMLVQMGTSALSSNLFMSAISIGQTLITMASFAALLIAFSPALALLGMAVGASFGLVELRYSKRHFSLSRSLIKLRRRVGITRSLLANPFAAHEIQKPGAYDGLRSRMLDEAGDARDREHALEKTTHFQRSLVGGGELLTSFGVYAWLLWRLLRGAITLGDVMLYRSAFATVSGGVQSLGRSMSSLLESDLQLEHLFEFLEGAPAGEPAAIHGDLPFPSRLHRGIEIRRLSFQYPNMDRPVLENVSLTLEPGRITAIVGPNGSGKTTLLKLLAGIYPAPRGCITLEGADICEHSAEDYARSVYMWGIGSFVHPLTVRENIALCRFADRDDDEALADAAERAAALDIISGLPGGMETMLTRALDGGHQLSWGQNMRIVLARAIFSDARILLIDEPGAGMDYDARQNLLALIRGLRKDRIIVVASHDPAIVAIADVSVDLSRTSVESNLVNV